MFRRINAWIGRPDNPPDPFGDALFRINKAMLVYVLAPLTVVLIVAWLV